MSKISKVFGGGKDKSAANAARDARNRETERQKRLTEGRTSIDSAFAGFDDPYYEGISKSYADFAQPQLDEDYAEQKKRLIYALSRGSGLASTNAGQKQAKLRDTYERGKQQILSKGQEYGTNARKDVSDSRSRLLSVLSSTEDPSTVANEAVREAAVLRTAPSFDPIGSVFSDFADDLQGINTARSLGRVFSGNTSGLYQDRGRSSGGRVVM